MEREANRDQRDGKLQVIAAERKKHSCTNVCRVLMPKSATSDEAAGRFENPPARAQRASCLTPHSYLVVSRLPHPSLVSYSTPLHPRQPSPRALSHRPTWTSRSAHFVSRPTRATSALLQLLRGFIRADQGMSTRRKLSASKRRTCRGYRRRVTRSWDAFEGDLRPLSHRRQQGLAGVIRS